MLDENVAKSMVTQAGGSYVGIQRVEGGVDLIGRRDPRGCLCFVATYLFRRKGNREIDEYSCETRCINKIFEDKIGGCCERN